MKRNDYYYRTNVGEWLSWREVCERRRYEDVTIVEKISRDTYHSIYRVVVVRTTPPFDVDQEAEV